MPRTKTKKEKTTFSTNSFTFSTIFKWLVVIWSAKQAVVIVGSLTSVFSLIFPWIAGTKERGVQLGDPIVLQYNVRDENYDFIYLAMMKSVPVVVKGLDHTKLQRKLMTKEGLQSIIKTSRIRDVKVSKNNTFTYFSYESEWYHRYGIKPSFEQRV